MPTVIQPLRRRMLGGLGLLATAPFVRAALADPSVVRVVRPLMGTRVGIVAQGADRAEVAAAIDAAFAEMARLESLMSRWRADSQVAALARSAGAGPVALAPEVLDALQLAQAMAARSDGAFDVTVGAYAGWSFEAGAPRVPARDELVRERSLVGWRDLALDMSAGRAALRRPGMRVDLGGVAKLPILQAGQRVLARHGLRDTLVDGGGDVLVSGTLQGRAWRIGVRDPAAPGRLLGTVSLTDGVVASSGDYERCFERDGRRYHHVLDPRTGEPAEGVHGVAMVARDPRDVAALGAAAMASGFTRGRALLRGHDGIDALLVGVGGAAWTSPGMAARLAA